MITLRLSNGTYRFSEVAFAQRLLRMINRRGWTTLAQAQQAVSNMPFNAAGWRVLKQTLGELLFGSVLFPNDLQDNGLTPLLNDQEVADRDVSGGIT